MIRLCRRAWQRWSSWSLPTRLGLAIGIIGTLATLLGISAASLTPALMNWLRPQKPPQIPPLSVWITNSSSSEGSVVPRGQLFIWLPGEGTPHVAGAYEVTSLDLRPLNPGMIPVPANSVAKLMVKILNPRGLYPYLERGDCEITLFFRRGDGSLFDSGELPFTEEGLKKYYAKADVASK